MFVIPASSRILCCGRSVYYEAVQVNKVHWSMHASPHHQCSTSIIHDRFKLSVLRFNVRKVRNVLLMQDNAYRKQAVVVVKDFTRILKVKAAFGVNMAFSWLFKKRCSFYGFSFKEQFSVHILDFN